MERYFLKFMNADPLNEFTSKLIGTAYNRLIILKMR